VSAPNRTEVKFTVRLDPGKTTKVEVAPGPTAASTAPTTPYVATELPTTSNPPADNHNSGRGKTAGYVFGGIGIAGLVVGGVAGALTLSEKSTNNQHCNAVDRTCDAQGRDAARSGRVFGVLTTAGLAMGVVGLGLGTYFLVKSSKGTENQTALVTQAGPAAAQLSLVRQW